MSRTPLNGNGFDARTCIFRRTEAGKFVIFGPHIWMRCGPRRAPSPVHVTRQNGAPPSSDIFRSVPFMPSWNEGPHSSPADGVHTASCNFGEAMRVDQNPGFISNQSSGRDRSTDCWRMGFGPVP